jgi:hypothetical protein
MTLLHVELVFSDSQSAQNGGPSGSRVPALRRISLSLRTMGSVVNEQKYQRNAAGPGGRATEFLAILVSITPWELLLPFV